MATIFYDKDCDLKLLEGKVIGILGYGSQGHAHAQNLRDSGCQVIVAELAGTPAWDSAKEAGHGFRRKLEIAILRIANCILTAQGGESRTRKKE